MFQGNTVSTRTPRLWPFLIICAVVGWAVSLGEFHKGHCSDTLVPILVSLQKWTPYFWEQDRIGMLVPLVTLPLRDPLLNLLVQGAIYASTGLAAMFLLARYMLRDGSYALAGTLSAVGCLGLGPARWFFDFTAAAFYGVWLALGLGGLVLAEVRPGKPVLGWRWLMALGLVVLAHWVYLATALLLAPLVVARFLVCGQGTKAPYVRRSNGPPSTSASTCLTWIRKALMTEFGSQMLLLSVGFALGYLFFRLETLHWPRHTDLGSLPVAQWPSMWHQLGNSAWRCLEPDHWPFLLFGTALAGLVSFGHPAGRRQAGVAWQSAIAVGIAAIVYFLFVGTRRWVHMNGCNARYTFPSLFLLQGALAICAVGPLTPAIKNRLGRCPYFLATVGLVLASLISFHSPSVKKVHNDLTRTLGGRTTDILASHCTHVAGDYWKVWPAVFHANLTLREQGESGTVWGITLCGGPTHSKWQHMPLEALRIAVPLDDREEADAWLRRFHLPAMVIVERRSTIYVLRPAAVVSAEQRHTSSSAVSSPEVSHPLPLEKISELRPGTRKRD